MHAGRLAENNCELGGQFLMLWSFIAEFSPVIAFRPISLQHLMEAVQAGSLSEALVNLHIAFIRFIQSEAEIANAIGSVHVRTTSESACYPVSPIIHCQNSCLQTATTAAVTVPSSPVSIPVMHLFQLVPAVSGWDGAHVADSGSCGRAGVRGTGMGSGYCVMARSLEWFDMARGATTACADSRLGTAEMPAGARGAHV